MNCPDCGTENKDDAKFCKKCGASLDSIKTNVINNKNNVQTEKKE